jgi:hypothetical protein
MLNALVTFWLSTGGMSTMQARVFGYLFLGSFILLILLLIGFLIYWKLIGSKRSKIQKLRASLLSGKRKKSWIQRTLTRAYPAIERTPVLSYILNRVRTRLQIIYIGDESVIRPVAVRYTLIMLGVSLIGVFVAMVFASSLYMRMSVIISGMYMASGVNTFMVRKVEKAFLNDLVESLQKIADEYQQYRMLLESLEIAGENSSKMVSPHIRNVLKILTSEDPEYTLNVYYQVAPSKYLRQFAGITYSTYLKGDDEDDSLYLEAISSLIEDIRNEIMDREKLDYQIAGVPFTTTVPVFFIEPLKNWSVAQFAVTRQYYESNIGIYALFIIYVTVITAFFGSQLIATLDNDKMSTEGRLLRRFLKYPRVRRFVTRIIPVGAKFNKVQSSLRKANSTLSVRELYFKKLLLAILLFISGIVIQTVGQSLSKNYALTPVQVTTVKSAADNLKKQTVDFERDIILKLSTMNATDEELVAMVNASMATKRWVVGTQDPKLYAQSLVDRAKRYESQYFKWYYLVIAFSLGCLGYQAPNIELWLRRSVRAAQAQNEVEGFYTIIGMLYRIKSIMVYEILDWMYSYSVVYRVAISRSLAQFERGGLQSLERLKDLASGNKELVRIVDRLMKAYDSVPVNKAFAGILADREFSKDKRALDSEKRINRRSQIATHISMLPFYSVLIFYLVFPFSLVAYQKFVEVNAGIGSGLGG